MLDTLYKFGRQLSLNADREEFDDVITTPPIDEKEKSKGINFYVASIIFDLDAGTFNLGELKPFSEGDRTYQLSGYKLRCIKIQGGNNKSIYPTVDPRKSFDPWKKTLFGKEDKDGNPPKRSELAEAIRKDYPDLASSTLYKAMELIFKMRDEFEITYPDWKKVTEDLKLEGNSRIAMLYAMVVSKDLGILQPCAVTQLDGYDDFLRRKFLQKDTSPDDQEGQEPRSSKLCYVTGQYRDDVGEPAFDNRYSLNKMFVTTTKNYATGFEDKNFSKNYQAGSEAQVFLERGSAHFLKNYKVDIAGITHCIIPKFKADQDIDLDSRTTRLKKKSELLFLMTQKQMGGLLKDLDFMADGGTYWLNFLGFESDGNFFKTINLITDVSQTHFEKVLQALDKVEIQMSDTEGVEWGRVMTYGKEQNRFYFNFYTIFSLIPIRKEKRNDALILFKAILEKRPILREKMFEHFSELIQCQRSKSRAEAHTNIRYNSNFDFAVRDAVFQYHAFLQLLKIIKLLDMDDQTPASAKTLDEKNANITTFFERMGYSDDQRAVFYLGRILNNVGFAQSQKGHASKPVLNKLNYNGMDASMLKRLHADLFEKCRQYDVLKFNEGNFSKFTDLFKDEEKNRWDKRIKPDESLFYLLSGYSFRTSKESTNGGDLPETASEI